LKKKAKSTATTRQTSGLGYSFEDLTAGWLMVKMLRGILMPGTALPGLELLWQTEALGWDKFDDILVKCGEKGIEASRLAISCKSNSQVTSSGLPAETVISAWKIWKEGNPFHREKDCLMLIQKSTNQNFFSVWDDLKSWCVDGDWKSAKSKIEASNKHSKIYKSIQSPNGLTISVTDEEVVNLIQHLEIVTLDYQSAHSETLSNAIAACRDVVKDGSVETAKKLWSSLIEDAKERRTRGGTLRLPELWKNLSENYELKNHPDYASSWETLVRITEDNIEKIETTISSGHRITRKDIKEKLVDCLDNNKVVVVYGSSGSGKSALVKTVLEEEYRNSANIWLSPEDLEEAISERKRRMIGLSQPLLQTLESTTNKRNILVLDSAERINPDSSNRVKNLISNLAGKKDSDKNLPSSNWQIVITGQTESWATGYLQHISGVSSPENIEITGAKPTEVRKALNTNNRLSWLASHDDAVEILRNLRTLAWIFEAEPAFEKNELDSISIPHIADRLWAYWTGNKLKVQKLLMNLAERDSHFERSFPISKLSQEDCEALDENIDKLPLRRKNESNTIEFEHDLAADWARFQILKEIKHDTTQWGSYASNPLWHSALRMLGQVLLREEKDGVSEWERVLEEAEKSKDINPLAADILLDSLCLDPLANKYLSAHTKMLLSDSGARLNRLLRRFNHIATVANVPEQILELDPSLKLYLEDYHRVPIYGRWPKIVGFITQHNQKISNLISPVVAKFCETWLSTTPLRFASGEPIPFRQELADLAVKTARALQLEQGKRTIFMDDSEKPIYAAAFSAAIDLPDEVAEWALEMAYRRPYRQDIVDGIAKYNKKKREKEEERLRTDKAYRERIEQLRSTPQFISSHRELPPWPLGPQGCVDQNYRKYCLQPSALTRLMVSRPLVAAELLLALMINDSPVEDYSRNYRLEDDLGLEFDHSAYPTAYWKSPFFQFLQLNSIVALDTVVQLVNFCMDRWEDNYESVSEIEIPVEGFKQLKYKGDMHVFSWSQENSTHSGQLHSALAALERWICLSIEKGEDVTKVVRDLMESTESVAILGVLINVGKYKIELFNDVLQPLLGIYELYMGDENRVNNLDYSFDAFSWVREGEKIFEMAKGWVFAPYRRRTLREIAIGLINNYEDTAKYIRTASRNWEIPTDRKSALEKKTLVAQLDRQNYTRINTSQTEEISFTFRYPDDLRRELESFQQESNTELQMITLPRQCEEILQKPYLISDEDAEILSNALDDAAKEEDAEIRRPVQSAIAATLLVKASSWLNGRPELVDRLERIIGNIIKEIGNTVDSYRSPAHLTRDNSLAFAAYYVAYKWIENETHDGRWDNAILKILTSNDERSVNILIDSAHNNRDRLGGRWWRLLKISILWSGLRQLIPRTSENSEIEGLWERWLERFRDFKLDTPTTIESLELIPIAKIVERMRKLRIDRRINNEVDGYIPRRHPRFVGLDTYYLSQSFSWLLNSSSQQSVNIEEDRLLITKLWEYEVWSKNIRNGDDDLGDELPSKLGYALIDRMSKLLAIVPTEEAATIWKPVLELGVEGHYAIEHFIDGWFLEISRSKDFISLKRVWREMIEFALSSANWSPKRSWYKGEQMFRHLLGINTEILVKMEGAQQAVLEKKDLYKKWAENHLSQDEDNIASLAYFLSSNVGVPIRLDGLLWIKEALMPPHQTYWRRESTGSSLIQLLDIIVNQESQRISSNSALLDALLNVSAYLAARQVPLALALQERIRKIH